MADEKPLDNPAVLSQTKIPPSLLEEIGADIDALTPTARVMYAIKLDQLFRDTSKADTPFGQKMQVLEHLAKTSGAHAKAQAAIGSSGPAFTINFMGAPAGSVSVKAVGNPGNAAKADVIDMERVNK